MTRGQKNKWIFVGIVYWTSSGRLSSFVHHVVRDVVESESPGPKISVHPGVTLFLPFCFFFFLFFVTFFLTENPEASCFTGDYSTLRMAETLECVRKYVDGISQTLQTSALINHVLPKCFRSY